MKQRILIGSIILLVTMLYGCGGGSTSDSSTSNTGNSPGDNTGGTTGQNTSTVIITSYMSTAHQVEADAFTNDLIALNRQLASQGLSGSGYAVVQIKDLKLSHIHNFVSVSLQCAANTKSVYVLDKPAIKSLFTNYQTTDVSDITATVSNSYTSRGLSVNQSVLSSAVTDVNNTYSLAYLQIDVM